MYKRTFRVYIVDALDDKFDSALEELGTSPAVGIKLEGVIKRAGIHIFSLSTVVI